MNDHNTNNGKKKKAYVAPAMKCYILQRNCSLLQASVHGDGIDYGGAGDDEYGD